MRRALPLPLLASLALLLGACGGTVTKTVTHQTTVVPTYQTQYGPSAHSPTFGLNQHPSGALPPPLSPTASSATLTMLDSVSDFSVFSGLHYQALAGYLPPSSWPTYAQFRARFRTVVAVDVQAFAHGQHGATLSCLDVEPGDATPGEVTGWVVYEVHHGFKPCVYGSLSEFSAINASIAASHVTVHVFRWCADWTFFPHLDVGCDAVQWTDHYDNRNIDASVVTYVFLGIGRPKPPSPKVICFGKHQQHSAHCDQVRQADAVLGRTIKVLLNEVKVGTADVAALDKKIAALEAARSVQDGRLAAQNRRITADVAALNKSLAANGCGCQYRVPTGSH